MDESSWSEPQSTANDDGKPRQKRIAIGQVKPGMYVVDLDRSWLDTPFLFHRKLIKSSDEIELFKKHGIQEVVIDLSRGCDADVAVTSPAVERPQPVRPERDGHHAGQSKKPSLSSLAERIMQPMVKELDVARGIHEEALATARTIFDNVKGGATVEGTSVVPVVANLLQSIARSPEANVLLMQMQRFQNDLFVHAVNVSVLAMIVAQLDGDNAAVAGVGLGALLHDVGESRLPRNLLRKKGELNAAEKRLIENHPTLGAALIDQSVEEAELARLIVTEHHERLNGTGYPCGLLAGQISPYSQTVALADAYNELLSGRTCDPLPPADALRRLFYFSSEGQFDRNLLERFIRCLGVYPAGSLVELSTGERGVVIAANREDSLKPTLRLISTREGLALKNGPIISLLEQSGDGLDRTIVRVLDPTRERLDPLSYLRNLPGVTK